MCMSFRIALLVCGSLGVVSAVHGSVITFDEPGYVAGNLPPAPWEEEYGQTDWGVIAGGVGGTQALGCNYGQRVTYNLPTPLDSSMGPQKISILFDPGAAVSNSLANYLTYGGLMIGNGSRRYGTGTRAAVSFNKQGTSTYNIYGPGSAPGTLIGAFTPSASANFYEITFEINAAWNSLHISVGPMGGATTSMDYGWNGSPITRVWPLWSDTTLFGGSWATYDNLTFVPEPSSLGDLNNDSVVNNQDIAPFVLALTDLPSWQAAYPGVDILAVGDINGDTAFNNQDIAPFVTLLTGGGASTGETSTIPEPASLGLLAIGSLMLISRRRRA